MTGIPSEAVRAGRVVGAAIAMASIAALVGVSSPDHAATGTASFPLDPTWAADQPLPGLIRLPLQNLPDEASLLRVLPDGSALVTLLGISPDLGYGDGRRGIAKFRPNGTLDATFNPGGSLPGVIDQFDLAELHQMEVDHHGRIVIAGDGEIVRLLANGTPDPTFTTTCINPCVPGKGEQPPVLPPGKVYVTPHVNNIAVLADDSLIVLSSTDTRSGELVEYVTKLTPTGDRDLTFNPSGATPGILRVDDHGGGRLLVQPDGSFLLVAFSAPARLHRITAQGTLDLTFGSAGTASVPIAFSAEVVQQAEWDGSNILVVLVSPVPGPPSLARFHTDGTTDTTFGTSGRLRLERLGALYSAGFLVLNDGRIIVGVGDSRTATLARLTSDGHLDASFNPASTTPGWLIVDPAPEPQHGHALSQLAETTNETLLAAGSRVRIGQPNTDAISEIYRFNAFPGAPVPIEPYPISAPPTPPPSGTIDAAATALQKAVRISLRSSSSSG
jgi:uncharacterized delta-60 repeat protein